MIGVRDDIIEPQAKVVKMSLYDGKTTTICPMRNVRIGFSAVVSGDCILVFGGRDPGTYSPISTCEKYDPNMEMCVKSIKLY